MALTFSCQLHVRLHISIDDALWQFIYSTFSKDRPLEWIYIFPTRRMSIRQIHALKGNAGLENMATKCLSGPSFSVRILPGCCQGQPMGCHGGSHEKGSCWDDSEKSYIHPNANGWDVFGADSRALRLAIRG